MGKKKEVRAEIKRRDNKKTEGKVRRNKVIVLYDSSKDRRCNRVL